ncbi:MAG: hypothetical protein ACXWG9_16120 [Usitatibacter sp.]
MTAILLVAAAMLAACGAMPKIDGDPAKLSGIRSITVIRAPEPQTYTMLNLSHPGMAFGLIGGLVAASDAEDKAKMLSKAYHKQGRAIAASLAAKVADALKRDGYETRTEDGNWVEKDGKRTLEFAAIRSDADAVLVVTPAIIGFVAPRMGADYYPTITVGATLLGKDRKEKIYVGFHASGWEMTREGWHNTAAAVTYPNFTDLMRDTRASAASLDAAAEAIAATIAADLKRKR